LLPSIVDVWRSVTGGTSAQASEGQQTILTGRPIAAPTARCSAPTTLISTAGRSHTP
jgi:hypothetical protein